MKKGFTLIELLAVIVILAIIALVAIPTVTNIVEEARKGVAKDSAYGYIDAVEKYAMMHEVNNDKYSYNLNDKTLYVVQLNSDIPALNDFIIVNGKKPTSGTIVVNEKGKVSEATLTMNGYNVTCTSDSCSVGDKNNSNPSLPKIPNPISFETDSWETIINAVRNNNVEKYKVGDTKTIDMGERFGTHTVRIANMSTPSECENDDFSNSACGFVIEFVDLVASNSMSPSTDSDILGWPSTGMRTYVNNDIYNNLPDNLKLGIIDTKVITGSSKTDTPYLISTDKLYLLSICEIVGKSSTDKGSDATRQLDYYIGKTKTDRIKNTRAGVAYYWWVRSLFGTTSLFDYIKTNGETNWSSITSTNTDSRGVSPAFRIG